jgi:hypothetical protein
MSSRIVREPDSRLYSGYPDIDFPRGPAAASPLAARPPGRRRLALAAALAASAAVALALFPALQTPAPTAPAAVAAPEPEVAELAPRAAPPLRIVRSEPPRPRPAAVAPRPPIVTMATRNLPLGAIAERGERPTELRLAELTTARARMIDAAMPLPLHRPDAAEAVELASLGPVPDPRPARRPAAAPEPPAEAADRPLPRPVAALAPEGAAAIRAAIGAPLARPDGLQVERPAAAAPAPKRVSRVEDTPPVRVVTGPAREPEPARAVPAPKQVRTAAPTPKPVRVVAAPPKPVRVVAAPKAARVLSQQPLRVASAPGNTAPRREASRVSTSRAAGFSRGNMSLIGVFGSASERRALVRLPNGRVERVGPGDRIQGVQVAAVGADSVRLTRGGRETLLRLPD